jgi:sugar lactone lactonase YvrE
MAAPALRRRPARVFVDGTLGTPRLDHPEGLAVDPADGTVYCGGESGQVYRVEPDGSSFEQVADTGGFCLGVAIGPDGAVYVCDLAHAAVLRVELGAGRVERFAEGADGHRLKAPNHLAFDAHGQLYVSDCRGRGDVGPALYRFAADGSGELWTDEPFHFANGLALDAGGAGLYVAESWARQVRRVPIGAAGQAGDSTVVAELPGTIPDGLAVAADGSLYVALYEPSRIVRIAASGAVGVVAEDPDAHLLCHPTNLAFRGEELLVANLGRWHLTIVDAGVRGLALGPWRAA